MNSTTNAGTAAAERIAHRLTKPGTAGFRPNIGAQSLGAGALGGVLLHFERIRLGLGDAATARAWLRAVAHPNVNSTTATNLFNGAPAIAFVLHATDAPSRYDHLRARLHEQVQAITTGRLALARERLHHQRPTGFAEYSQLSGLSGLATYLLATEPGSDLTGDVLTFLVTLTKPIRIGRTWMPGWWADHDPFLKQSPEFPGGHLNMGAAHGIPGPLTALALAYNANLRVPGQRDAIEWICRFYDTWQHEAGWWPQWLTREDLDRGRASQPRPGRPSWCYGTPGIVRALQLAAIALDDPARQAAAEGALARCLNDADQTSLLVEGGLCHGTAGLYRITQRVAEDASGDRFTTALADLEVHLAARPVPEHGFLDGEVGLAFTLQAAGPRITDESIWDAALGLAAPKVLR
ncbi:lanthionine synthetase C family protein [Glycomyces harbinensis]|uniref:Lanthionine synthetase C-like protein n=1 Tax=Glycomyces harbinensis TaxID=58114 RepID=A0A1G6Y9R8_9ACTN|nr:lanthionine synthetase C family protein [Glycomyces harbinensis]SDD86991.1 Lanthionine synthetase C-like protein [Glycomyces harbinensis]